MACSGEKYAAVPMICVVSATVDDESDTARATALLPPLLYLAQSLGLNPIAVMFIATVGMNYCLTFPVSSKALLMFYGLDERPFTSADLFRLSAVLLPANAALIVLFYFLYWRWIGLAL